PIPPRSPDSPLSLHDALPIYTTVHTNPGGSVWPGRRTSPGSEWIRGSSVERATGIEPAYSAWKAEALPLSYARIAASDQGVSVWSRSRPAHITGWVPGPQPPGPPAESAGRGVCRTLGGLVLRSGRVIVRRTGWQAARSTGMWRSLVAHPLWERRVAGSNPVIPTSVSPENESQTSPRSESP